MALAQEAAKRFNHEHVSTEHILLGLVNEGSGIGATVLSRLEIDLRTIRSEVGVLIRVKPDIVTMGKLPETPRAKKVIEFAIEEARNMNGHYVGTEHLLLGLLREHDGVAAQVLMNLGLKLEEVRQEVLNLLGAGQADQPNPESEELVLGEDITEEDEEDPDSPVEVLMDFFSGLEVLAREALDRLNELR